MKIGYVSPLPPDASGIADFAEELLPELKKHVDLEIFARIPVKSEKLAEGFSLHSVEELENKSLRESCDILVYQAGNNVRFHGEILEKFKKYPGILEIHDFAMHHYLAESTYVKGDYEAYVRAMAYCHGKRGEITARKFLAGEGRAPWENDALRYSVNKYLVDRAAAVITHSDMAKQMIEAVSPDKPIVNIPLHTADILENPAQYQKECRKKLGIKEDLLVLGSFGYATRAKRIPEIVEALGMYASQGGMDFHYYIVGKVEEMDVNIPRLAKQLGIGEKVTVTGFTDLDMFKEYMGACDICFNMRYPTQGESSASLHRILGMGKPVIVSRIGSFEEYPDDIVLKICHDQNEVHEILEAVRVLTMDEEELEKRSKKAIAFAKENCDLVKNAVKYADFFEQIHRNTFKKEPIDVLIDELFAKGLTSKKDIERLVLSEVQNR